MTSETVGTESSAPQTFEQKVKEVVSKMKADEKGILKIAQEDLDAYPEEVVFAAKLEKRRADTQAEYTRASQKLKELSTVNEKLTEHLVENATLHISAEQRNELEELKLRDPDVWREKLTAYESEQKELLKNKLAEIENVGKKLTELDIRKAQLDAFVETTGIQLDDDVIADQLPASYSKQLEKGEITFDEFLTKAQSFLTKEKIIKGSDETPENNVDLGKLPGSNKPSKEAVKNDFHLSYKNEIY